MNIQLSPIPRTVTSRSEKYRPDIDGLRAVAVLAVVAFHAFPASVSGGFVGVDVFFVISGFLISSILLNNLKSDTFGILEFYVRRVVRIFPALITVLFFCFAVGWLTLYASEYKQLGKHIAGGIGFISNFMYWQEAGYFDNASDSKPLLHLWSLGIEEQFYMIWPPLLYLGWRLGLNLAKLTFGLVVLSFVYSAVSVFTDVVAAFYSPLTRAWELLLGSMLAHAAARQPLPFAIVNTVLWKNVGALLGLGLIFIAVFTLNKTLHFPGALALLPAVGAALIIAAGADAWLNRSVLSNPVLVWFGLISFPLYLWHWPLLSFARIFSGATLRPQIIIIAVGLSVLLAWLTFAFIEKPIRHAANKRCGTVVLCVIALLIGAAGYVAYTCDGLPSRDFIKDNHHRFETPETFTDLQGSFQRDCSFEVAGESDTFTFMCSMDTRGVPRYALLGDSKAQVLYPSLARSANASNWLFVTAFPWIGDSEIYRSDNLFKPGAAEAIIDWLIARKDIETIVVSLAARRLFALNTWAVFGLDELPKSQNYAVAYSGVNLAIKRMVAGGKKVIFIVDNPTLLEARVCVQRNTDIPYFGVVFDSDRRPGCVISLEYHKVVREQYLRLVENLKRENPQLVVYDPTNLLCDVAKGECSFEKEGKFLYSYYDHISTFAASLIAAELIPLVDSVSLKESSTDRAAH
jgi:peptidoglycan/LPS O-acetylase OafA/YrhL